MSGQSSRWISKVISPSEEWINGAKADTQQHLIIPLFWDSECISAAGHQQPSEWDRSQSVMVSHCHFQRALHGTTARSFQEGDKAVIVSRSSFDWPLSHWEVHHHQSVRWVALRGSNASFLQVWRYDFISDSAVTINMRPLLCYYHENFNIDQKTLTHTKECHDRATKSVNLHIRFRDVVRDKTSNAWHNVLKATGNQQTQWQIESECCHERAQTCTSTK